MGKKRKHQDSGMTSMPTDKMPPEESSDAFPSSTCGVLIQLKDIIQVKVNTEESLQKLDERLKNLEKVKMNKIMKVQMKELANKIKEDLKSELIKEIKEDLKSELIKEIKEDLNGELIDKVKEDLKCELIKEIKEDLKSELIKEIKEDLNGELIDKVKEDLKRELMDKVKEDLKRELRNEIKEDLKREMINEVEENVKKELVGKFEEDLTRELIEDLKLELQEEMQKLEEKVDNKSNEHFSVLKKEPLEIEEGINREGSAKVNHCSASPSLRSHQTQTTTFQLAFTCKMETVVYKGKPIRTSDSDHIEVVLCDGGNPIAPDHHLASAAVELVVVDGEFGGHSQGYWSKEEFAQNIMKSRQWNYSKVEPPNVPVKNGSFKLDGGKCRRKGVLIMENSNRKDVKLGVMIVGNTEERVIEGVSNCFRVQEAKTQKGSMSDIACGKRIGDETQEDLRRYTRHNIPQLRNENAGQGQQYMHNFLNTLNPSGLPYHHTAANGSVGPTLFDSSQYPARQDITRAGSYATVQGPQHTFPRTEHNFEIVPNQSQKPLAHTAGNGPGGPTQQGVTQQEDHAGQGQQYMHNTLNPSGITYHHTTAKGSVRPLLYDTLQYPIQPDATRVGSYVQGLQHTFVRTQQTSGIVPNQSQITHAHTAGNGPGGQPLVDHQQQNTKLGATHQEDHAGQGQQYMHNTLNPSGITYHHTAGNGSLMQYRTQPDIAQVGICGSEAGLDPTVKNPDEGSSTHMISTNTSTACVIGDDGFTRLSAYSADHSATPGDVYQDVGATGPFAPHIAAPTAESTQMDFTQNAASWHT